MVEYAHFLGLHSKQIGKLSFEWIGMNPRVERFPLQLHALYLYKRFIDKDGPFTLDLTAKVVTSLSDAIDDGDYDMIDPDDSPLISMFADVEREVWSNLRESFVRFQRAHSEKQIRALFPKRRHAQYLLRDFHRAD